ncbi:hypothetical protein UK23_06205 [Lentzea aerocolonigenes]|uniref:ParB-like N-terminal domain-containing protein n=1 Tax=Lentzea aerocolonigenes TaxID=68170 RepID=A0A0F0H884_LENAE|nr:hypothetical protein UK23_06205 [Lentzea aerocolonigenes]
MEAEPEVVLISSLHAADSPRLQSENLDHARMLAQVEGELPPVVVHRRTMRVVDGMHRIRAALLRGEEQIEVRYVDVPEQELFLLAVRLNAHHGLPLSSADRRAAAARILTSHPQWSDRAIAAATGLAAKTVSGIRQGNATDLAPPETRIGRDGRRRPLCAAEGRRSAGELVKANPRTPLRQIAKLAGISLGTAADVRDRVLRGEDPVRNAKARSESFESAPVAEIKTAELADHRSAAMMMRILLADPSLRFNEPGRELLRWLGSRIIESGDWQAMVDEMPTHCTGTVADLARRCGSSWLEFAEELENRYRASA